MISCELRKMHVKAQSTSSPSTAKVERRIVEKNRRNHVRTLYGNLFSLLPKNNSKKARALPDRIDEAASYIKSLEEKLQKAKEKKETLMGREGNKTHSAAAGASEQLIPGSESPKIKIRQMGSALDIVLITTTPPDHPPQLLTFREILRMVHQEGAEVVSANVAAHGNLLLHAVHANIGEIAPDLVAARVSYRLEEFVNGSINREMELQMESQQFQIQTDDAWDLCNPETWPVGL
ncbi:transcription factor bHLH162-like [Diospyros lotus]|uniref:transcription factor bHLH162-like n=1 Tax=Diospyros lotus TaxID=55363 RepID=UPI00225866CF|nr:transcription factor bHLH162-like [Diospyros lotus]